jgi:hypothetical protein
MKHAERLAAAQEDFRQKLNSLKDKMEEGYSSKERQVLRADPFKSFDSSRRQFFKEVQGVISRVCAYATVALSSVGANALRRRQLRFKKLASGNSPQEP